VPTVADDIFFVQPEPPAPQVLADSSEPAFRMAGDVLPDGVARDQIVRMNLGWKAQWDRAFLLDVIEHLSDDARAMRQAAQANGLATHGHAGTRPSAWR